MEMYILYENSCIKTIAFFHKIIEKFPPLFLGLLLALSNIWEYLDFAIAHKENVINSFILHFFMLHCGL